MVKTPDILALLLVSTAVFIFVINSYKAASNLLLLSFVDVKL